MKSIKFVKGAVLKTQIQDSIEWIPNVLVDIYPDTQEIAILFDERYNGNLILVGDAVKLNYVKDEIQYLIETWVTGIRGNENNIMTLKIVSSKEIVNSRKEERYSVNYAANIFNIEKPEGVLAVVTNISSEGIGFVAKDTFAIGEIVKIALYLTSRVFEINAEIIRHSVVKKGIEYGANFIKSDKSEMATLVALLNDIKEREDRLSRIVGFDRT